MVALATSGGAKAGKRKAPARPARSNKGGATRGKARAAQAQAMNKAKRTGASKAARGPKKAPTGMRKAPSAAARTQAATQVGVNAYRDYANSMTNLARTGIRGPGYQMPNIPNPVDVLGQGLGSLGQVVRDAFGNVVPQDALFRGIGESIEDAQRRR